MIKLEHVNKYYNKGANEIHVINDVCLELPSQGLVSLLGPSGSGKTTLLNVIGGLDKAKGRISYDNVLIEKYNMSKIDALRGKEIGYVFQNYNLLLEETVYRNLAIALELIGIYDKKEQEKRIEYTLNAVGMYKYRKKRAYALSGGQQQRVSIARALVKKAKVIIADEPTGNLDSENTIEVMNILKEISKTALVLMVTHNEEVASGYSDYIIKIKDGRIEETISNTLKGTISFDKESDLYLKDCKEQDVSFDAGHIKIYTEDSNRSYELTIYEKNGSLYIDSPQKIKLVQDSNLKIIHAHRKVKEKDEEASVPTFDNTWYDNSRSKRNIFSNIWNSLKTSFNLMRFAKKRMKFLYFSFAIIGVLLAFCVIGYTSYNAIDDTQVIADNDYYNLTSKSDSDYLAFDRVLEQATSEGYISDFSQITTIDISLKKSVNFQENLDFRFYCNVLPYLDGSSVHPFIGEKPSKGEILLGKQYAKYIIDTYPNFYPSYQSLIGQKMVQNSYSNSYTISGISDNTTQLSYLSDYDYLKSYEFKSVTPLYFFRDHLIEKRYDSYTIVSGRDFNEGDLNYNSMAGDPTPIVLPYNFSENAEELLNRVVPIKQDAYVAPEDEWLIPRYLVVGLYKMNDFETRPDELMTYDPHLSFNFTPVMCFCYDNYEDCQIVEGRGVERYNECVVTIYSGYEIGDKVNGKTVVGRYNGNRDVNSKKVLIHRDAVVMSLANPNDRQFRIKDEAKFKTIIAENFQSAKIISSYQNAIEPMLQIQRSNMMVFGLFTMGLLVGITIFMYFMMRSRMVNEIYNIGVYRCLGASKAKLLGRFLSEIIVLITLTSLVGYVITLILINGLLINVNSLINEKISILSIGNAFAGLGILYLLALVFGLLPIWSLLKKTPAEIVAKYDI